MGVIQRITGFPILFAARRVWTDSFSGVDADFGMHTFRRSDAVSRLRKVVRMNESRNFIVLCDQCQNLFLQLGVPQLLGYCGLERTNILIVCFVETRGGIGCFMANSAAFVVTRRTIKCPKKKNEKQDALSRPFPMRWPFPPLFSSFPMHNLLPFTSVVLTRWRNPALPATEPGSDYSISSHGVNQGITF